MIFFTSLLSLLFGMNCLLKQPYRYHLCMVLYRFKKIGETSILALLPKYHDYFIKIVSVYIVALFISQFLTK